MKISAILKKKSSQIETTRPDRPVGEAAVLLVERGIGSLVVCDEANAVLGILTERDIVRGIAERGPEAVGLVVSDVMSRALVCTPDLDAKQATRVMTAERARHVVVMVGDRIQGVVSIGDVVHSRLDHCELEVGVLRDYTRVNRLSAPNGSR